MEAKELKLDNIVEYEGCITHISGIGYGNCCVGENQQQINDLDYLYGVPLTEEWLLKFGFDPEDDLKHPDAPIYFCEVRGELICFLHNCSHRHIKHVHDLQNLFFAVTGEELILKTE